MAKRKAPGEDKQTTPWAEEETMAAAAAERGREMARHLEREGSYRQAVAAGSWGWERRRKAGKEETAAAAVRERKEGEWRSASKCLQVGRRPSRVLRGSRARMTSSRCGGRWRQIAGDISGGRTALPAPAAAAGLDLGVGGVVIGGQIWALGVIFGLYYCVIIFMSNLLIGGT